jgi:serine/threonine protein kinase
MLVANTLLQNRYRIVRQLGEGGMGVVYEAVDQRLSSVVAIKETRIATEEGRQAFVREASLLANLRHPSLPNVIDYFSENESQYLVMQFIPGDDLGYSLQLRGRPFDVAEVLRWANELLKALEYLHGHTPSVLHRDIKPSNLKLTREGELFLIDFGLSKGVVGQMPTLVTSRSVKGYTPAYSPLEQIHGGGTDPRSDLYSVGATLYHLLTNVVPADAPTRFNAFDELQPDPLVPADKLNRSVPHDLAQILTQAMAMNRRHRPSSATAMRQMLRQVMPLETAITISKQATPEELVAVPISVELPSAAPVVEQPDLRPTEPAATTTPLPPARHTDSDLKPPTEMKPPQPTLQEIPNLIERPVSAATTPLVDSRVNVVVAQPERRITKTLIGVAVAIPLVVVLLVGAGLLVPRLLKRTQAPQQPQSASGTIEPQAPLGKPTAPATNKKMFSGDFDTGKALALVYGSYDAPKKYVKWKITKEDLNRLSPEDRSTAIDAGMTVYTAANLVAPFTEAGVQKRFLITETVPAHYDCHACAPLIGGAVFSQQGNDWQLDAENRFVTVMGGWGTAPKGKLAKIGPERYAIVFHPGGTGQGITEEAVSIMGEVQDTVKELLTILEYAGDNAGACGEGGGEEGMSPCWKFSSKMDFEPGAKPDYFDIKVTTTGTKEDDNGKIRKANAVKKYVFVEGKYMPAK